MSTILLVGGPADGCTFDLATEKVGAPCRVAATEYYAHHYDASMRLWVYTVEPQAARAGSGRWQACHSCDVKWWGDVTCWCCGRTVVNDPHCY